MSQLPYPISDDWAQAKYQIQDLLRMLFEERIGGLRPKEIVSTFKMGKITRSMDAETGSVSYTGIGFKPTVLFFMCWSDASIAIGMDSVTNSYFVNTYTDTTQYYGYQDGLSIELIEDHDNYQTAYVKSMDEDGFTLLWNKTGSPAAASAYVCYGALR